MKYRIRVLIKGVCITVLTTLLILCCQKQHPGVKGHPESSINHNVLVITLDTTRADRIGIYDCDDVKTPHIDSLAHSGVRFARAYSQVPVTLPSHCTLFTGTYPLYHGVRYNGRYFLPDRMDTLAEILERQGYVTSAFVSSFTVDSRFGLNQGFSDYNDEMASKERMVMYHSERSAGKVFEAFSQWFLNHSSEKFFTWVHFYDPHHPYEPPEPYRTEYKSDPYLGEIAYVDEYIGRITDLLESRQVFDRTLIIIAGDHGEAFGEHQEYGHTIFCYEENVRIPLIMVAAKRLPENITLTENVGLVDIMPTVLEFLGMPVSPEIQGISLLPLIEGRKQDERSLYMESYASKEELGCAPVVAVMHDNWKYIDLPRPELYDLSSDPGEKNNLVQKESGMRDKLRSRLESMKTMNAGINNDSLRTITEEEKQQLVSLGYLSISKTKSDNEHLSDPKDNMDAYNDGLLGMRAFLTKDYKEAERLLQKSIERNPDNLMPYPYLAIVYDETGRTDKAVQIYDKAMTYPTKPNYNAIRMEYVEFLYREKKYDEALKLVAELDDSIPWFIRVKMYLLRGLMQLERKNIDDALLSFRNANELEPDNRLIKQQYGYCLRLTNRYDEALKIYLELEKQYPEDPKLIRELAYVSLKLRQPAEAEKYYRRLVILGPDPPDYFDYATLLAHRKEYVQAVLNMEKFINLFTHDNTVNTGSPQVLKANKLISEWNKHVQ